jgi:hypothetical protein
MMEVELVCPYCGLGYGTVYQDEPMMKKLIGTELVTRGGVKEVTRETQVEIPVEVVKEVRVEVPVEVLVEVVKEVEVLVEVPVEVIREVEVLVEVEVPVEIEVVKEVVRTVKEELEVPVPFTPAWVGFVMAALAGGGVLGWLL